MSDDELGALVEDVLKSGKHATHDAASQAGARAPSAVFPEPPREDGSQAEDPATYDWFVAIDNKSVGPLGFEKVKKLWEDGEIDTDTPCWRNGLGDWQPLNRVESLAKALLDRPKPKPAASIPRPQRRMESGSWKPAVRHLLEEALEEKKPAPLPAAAAPQPAAALAPAAPAESAPSDATVKVAIAPPAVTGPSNEELERSIRQLSSQVRSLQEQISELPEPPPRPRVLPIAALSGLLSGAVVAAALLFFKPMVAPTAAAPVAPAVTQAAPPAAPQPAAAAPAPAPSPTPAASAAAPPPPTPQAVAQAPAAKPKPKVAAPATAAATEGAATAPVKATKPAEPAKPKDDFEREFGEGGSPSDEAPKPAKAAAKPASDVPEELDESAIMSTVLRHKSEVDQCTRQAKQADPEASGRVVMRWTIHPDGHTSNVSVQNEDFAGTPVAACLERLIKKWSFPKHQAQHDPVSFPFVL